MEPALQHLLQQCQNDCKVFLSQLIQGYPALNTDLINAIEYALLSGGKRVRPLLVYAAAKTTHSSNAIPKAATVLACAIECIHAYSLVHDDLPAMDDDDLRRGQPTTHKKFNEATAILAGDALQTMAFEIIVTSDALSDAQKVAASQVVAKASGALGMVLGQAVDLSFENTQPKLAQLANMHQLKTGALINAAVDLGAIASHASTQQRQALSSYAEAVGLAFQVQDDILDVTATTEQLGKPQGSDEQLNKATYVSLLGLESARKKALNLNEQALTALNTFGDSALELHQLANYIVQREY